MFFDTIIKICISYKILFKLTCWSKEAPPKLNKTNKKIPHNQNTQLNIHKLFLQERGDLQLTFILLLSVKTSISGQQFFFA